MNKFIKTNLKIILAVFITAIICISGTAFAALKYQASQVEYKGGKSVEQALNDLYNKYKNSTPQLITSGVLNNNSLTNTSFTYNFTKKYNYIIVFVSAGSDKTYASCQITSDLSEYVSDDQKSIRGDLSASGQGMVKIYLNVEKDNYVTVDATLQGAYFIFGA